ncbi:OTU-like cysteine protease [Musa troglodytarum]|uniref:OTU-like cysteine protease n=1 Tax=Musa troglodytarum TaxID=320322 RepID=A0A9E7HZB4_9LILI|nr:OTU-like cysteine protease [Musa troglodytarum]
MPCLVRLVLRYNITLMIMYEQDPDLVRWGLHLLLEPPSNSTYCATSSHSSTDDSGLHCADETGSWEARDSVENDEVIAHALQEELSQIAMVEASGPSLHVPRINKELPSVDEEISDHQRLLERVTSFGG